MNIFLIVGIVIAVVAVGYVASSKANNGIVGTIAGFIVCLLILFGLTKFADEAKSNARVDMAVAICVADVQETRNWMHKSVLSLMNATAESIVDDVLSSEERKEATTDCFEQLKEEALA